MLSRTFVRQTQRSSSSIKRLPNALSHRHSHSLPCSTEPQISSLPNGIRIASQNTPGHFAALGIYVDAGSRYESSRLQGVSHILDRLAFKSTLNATAMEMSNRLESIGGNIMCNSSRESIMYQASVFHKDISKVLPLLADTVRNPAILPEEVSEQQQTALYEISEIWSKPEMILPEIMHSVAYKGNTLGNPMLCPADRLESMTPELIQEYISTWYRPERIVIAATGVSHQQLVDDTTNLFGDMRSPYVGSSAKTIPPHLLHSSPSRSSFKTTSRSASSVPLNLDSMKQLSSMPAHYTGGVSMMDRTAIEQPRNENFTHVYIAFEGLPIYDPDIYALATLQMLLGGGGSFSAGGPGKGMYSRLYTRVLNQHYWVENCVSFNHCYTDSGLFGLSVMCKPEYNRYAVEVAIRELASTLIADPQRGGVSEEELSRAKNQLSSALLMSLETRQVQCEDLGRQVQVHGLQVPVMEMIEKISQVDMQKLREVAERVLTGKVKNLGKGTGDITVVAQGALQGLQDPIATYKRYLAN